MEMDNHYLIHIDGLVQGVGFRPFIYKLAQEHHLYGCVDNRNDGVYIELDCSKKDAELFMNDVFKKKPKIAHIHKYSISLQKASSSFSDFHITASKEHGSEITRISPDIAVCQDCLRDMETQPHRLLYPFVNCTHCGPRFSIIKDLPYDRSQTTMKKFKMCHHCQSEYGNITDRRFHAQPIACNHCGPSFSCKNRSDTSYSYYLSILHEIVKTIKSGGIVAMKGLGGYNLLCDAHNTESILRLRKIKHREKKPFAVMFPNEKTAKRWLYINKTESAILNSWRRPIVLLKEHVKLNTELNQGLTTLGTILPYLPIHFDLFRYSDLDAVVFSSGNFGNEPIIIENNEAEKKLYPISDLFVSHNRDIHNRVDDSIVQCINNNIQIIRHSRGYAPEPIVTENYTEGILAFGAEKTASFAIGKSKDIILSQHIGDLENMETFEFHKETILRFCRLFRFNPHYLVSDLHPDYLSTRLAKEVSLKTGIPLLQVQHHHAHAVSVMVEHNLHENVLAICMDGTGLGTDNCSWGGEFLQCNRKEFCRLNHFPYIALPGGDKAAKEGWRMAISYLHHYNLPIPAPLKKAIGIEKINMIKTMIDKHINTYYTSSCGRLFDAVSALLGICYQNSFQGEAAILLEHTAYDPEKNSYPLLTEELSFHSLFKGIITDLSKNISPEIIAAKFHNTLADILFDNALELLEENGLSKIVLSGGVFQNKKLLQLLIQKFKVKKIPYYYTTRIPCNDAGISVGQLGIGAATVYKNQLCTNYP